MTTNRLAKSEAQPKRTAMEICDEGNERLAGRIPYTCKKYAGQFHRRDDIRWVVRDGQPTLERAA